MRLIITVIAVVLVVEGIPYFAFPDKAKEWAVMMGSVPSSSLRIIGLVSMVLGLLILAVARFS